MDDVHLCSIVTRRVIGPGPSITYQATCLCGWEGQKHPEERLADEEYDAHLPTSNDS